MVSPAQTPIEEFTPTPAFPALQYLESVDEGGVAWRAGLRMGDFLIEVLSRFRVEIPSSSEEELIYRKLKLVFQYNKGSNFIIVCKQVRFSDKT